MNQLSVLELAAMIDEGKDLFLLDVREPHEVAEASIQGSHNIPLGELDSRKGEVPTDVPVVTMCRSGGRSARAAALLEQAGWKVSNLDGGMLAWQDAYSESVASSR